MPGGARHKRSRMLRGLSAKRRHRFYEQQRGTTHQVHSGSDNEVGLMQGSTENYVKVKTPFAPELVNTLQKVVLKKIDPDGIVTIDLVND